MALKAYLPGREKELRSGEAGKRTTIRFANRTDRTLKLYWIDSDGTRKAYGTLEPHETQTQHTFTSHVWLVTDADDRPLALYVAGAKTGLAEIR